MADLYPVGDSEHLDLQLGFEYKQASEVANSYWFTREVIERVHNLGIDAVDFFHNAGRIMSVAGAALNEEMTAPDYELKCRAKNLDDCGACLGSSYSNFAPAWVTKDQPSVDLTVNVLCHRAMVPTSSDTKPEAAPIELTKRPGRLKKITTERPLYNGVKVFDNGCYDQMGSIITRLAELVEEEVTRLETTSSRVT